MKHPSLVCRVALVMFVCAVSTWVPARADEPLPDDCMPSSEVRPGMVGEGRTVFHGFKVETFKATILGVEHNAMAGGNMILARLEGRYLDKHGVVAGMSGSPVYIDGRMIGAVAYGWSFAYEAYCGITPIENMWSVWNNIGQPGLRKIHTRGDTRADADRAWDWESGFQAQLARLEGEGDASAAQSVPTLTDGFRPQHPAFDNIEGEMRPLATPLFFSGASPRAERCLRRLFASRGVELMGSGTMAGSAGAGEVEAAPPLEDGSALAMPFVTGDLALAGVGTVTRTRGDKLIAFGHPMFNSGGSSAPIAQAYIFGFMESYARSFKLSEAREAVGRLDQDRLFAVGGLLGPEPPRTGMTVRMRGAACSRPRDYRFSIWRDAQWLDSMPYICLGEAYTASAADAGEMTVETDYTIRLSDGRAIHKRIVASSNSWTIRPAMRSLLMDLYLLLNNPFAEADVVDIEVDVNLRPGMRRDALVAAHSDRARYRAGESVGLDLRLRPWRGEEYTTRQTMTLPDDLKPGPYVVHVTDASGTLAIARAERPGLFAPRDFGDVWRQTRLMDAPDDELTLHLFAPTIGMDLKDHGLGGLPASAAGLVKATTDARWRHPTTGRRVASRSTRMRGVVTGSQSLLIEVVDRFNN